MSAGERDAVGCGVDILLADNDVVSERPQKVLPFEGQWIARRALVLVGVLERFGEGLVACLLYGAVERVHVVGVLLKAARIDYFGREGELP